MTAAMEFRVLSGAQCMARCPAVHGARVGANPHCDIVLTGEDMPEVAGWLEIDPSGWRLAGAMTPGLDARAPDLPVAFNEPVPLGTIWITVAAPSAPWPAPQPPAAPHAPCGPDSSATALHDDPGSASPPSAGALMPRRRAYRPWPRLALSAAAIVVLVGLASALVSVTAPAAPPAARAPTTAAPLIRAAALIDSLGLTEQLQAAYGRGGVLTVTGWVHDETEFARVARALAQLAPRPAMQVSRQDEARALACDVLAAFGVRYMARPYGNGHLAISGIASDAHERAAALHAVRMRLPGMTILDRDVRLAGEVSAQLAAQLADERLDGVKLSWHANRLDADPGELDAGRMARLRELVAAFNQRNYDVVRLPATAARATRNHAPFEIRSVVSGPQPYLMLADGSRLLVGGLRNQYRLTAIESGRLVFDGPEPVIVTR
ncbi:EscD/YscD/HrpQ family type III secretion system inner membrane ring protein [Bordetella bronchiseptica]|nr:EscD/YscD/HrpQ family type III secretion system inner membrane ring protein [Bordetella bronchiseptica]